MKELLFSVTKKDFDIDYFSGKGKGGQHRNRHKNCVRLYHRDSDTRVTGQSHKERLSNIKEALNNLVNHSNFKLWHKRKIREVIEGKKLEDKVEEMMKKPEDFKIEIKDENGEWNVSNNGIR